MEVSCGHLRPPVQKLVATLIFALPGAKMQLESCCLHQMKIPIHSDGDFHLVEIGYRTRRGRPCHSKAKNMPATCFLSRGRVLLLCRRSRYGCECRAIFFLPLPIGWSVLFSVWANRTRSHLNATIRWTVARHRLAGDDTLIFFHKMREEMQVGAYCLCNKAAIIALRLWPLAQFDRVRVLITILQSIFFQNPLIESHTFRQGREGDILVHSVTGAALFVGGSDGGKP